MVQGDNQKEVDFKNESVHRTVEDKPDYSWKIVLLNLGLAIIASFIINSGGYDTSIENNPYGLMLHFAMALGFVSPAAIVGGIAFLVLHKTNFGRKAFVIVSWVVVALGIMGNNGISFFGNSGTYDECMLEMMKGQPKSMIHHARNACERKYPYEKELYQYKSNLDISWWSDSNYLRLQIKKNVGDYKVTKYRASFSKVACDNIKSTTDYTLTKTFMITDHSISQINIGDGADEYKCMSTESIYGFRIR